MKHLLLTVCLMFVQGCVSGGNLEAYCVASENAVAAHATALSNTPDETVLLTGDLVIRQRDAACALENVDE